MFVILFYDVGEKRVGKALKICRKYLSWVQNSVFEGEISKANLVKLQNELKTYIDEDYDSIIYYEFRTKQYMNRQCIGQDKGGFVQFL
ncbi:CRISPR-associated endonuclease Cas2 [Eubacterium barkeri]|uniref:CRISPR-associated endoribonuclease Cas2 n=1 Tax=Eubacterium barkeri TaxID=1528 RepID=A0A1H3GRD6_EUBBA|nr:CRISPR-associated endonuclease Cas2 [Eubacterium barkeri]SDY05883.1 CRISPR-associated protein Cas2 [Eubacterium barkeri]